jgi:hypothetical protein
MQTRSLQRAKSEREKQKKRKQREKLQKKETERRYSLKKRQEKKFSELKVAERTDHLIKKIKKYQKKIIQLKEQITIQQKELERLGQELEKKEQKFQTQQEFVFESDFCNQLVTHYMKLPFLKKIIGMSKTSFKKLENQVKVNFNNLTVRGTPRIYNIKKENKISFQSHLYITLVWLRHYETMTKLSHDFGLTNLDLRDILLRTLTALDQTLDDEIKWPNDDEFEGIVSSLSAEVQEEFPDLGAIVDGTEVRIPRPSNYQKQKEYWSKKKHQHSLSIMLVCTPRGHLIFASDPRKGASDQHHWNELKMRKLFEDKPFAVMADSGFTPNPKSKPQLQKIKSYTPIRKPKGRERTQEDQIYNTKLSSVRAVIENVIARLKKWRILKGQYRHFSTAKNNQLDMNLVVRVVTKLTALDLKKSPPRSRNWSFPQKEQIQNSNESS